MKKPVLVVMAAGMGSRYGGLKQIDQVDKEGHIIMDFSIYDAVQAGFQKVVFIIKKENEADFRSAIGDRLSNQLEVSYVFQDLHNIPEGYEVPEGRVKPWGTGHAVLSCINEIDGPFVVINADDYYGKEAFVNAKDLKTITINGNVTKIGANAFKGINKKAVFKIKTASSNYKKIVSKIKKAGAPKSVTFKIVK